MGKTESKRDPSLHKGHRERMKARFLKSDLYDFEEHEILEMLLFYAIPRGDTNELAHRILNECGGSIGAVFNSSFTKLTSIKGVSDHTATLLKLIPKLSSYYASSNLIGKNGIPIRNTEKICDYFETLLFNSTKEEVYFAGVTDELVMESARLVYKGAISSALLNTGDFLSFISDFGYSRLIMAHNHPHGMCLPSTKDLKVTKYIVDSLRRMGLSVEDHIIVGRNGSMSMRSSRLELKIWDHDDTIDESGDNEPEIWQ